MNAETNKEMKQTATFGFSGQYESKDKEKEEEKQQKQYNFYKQLSNQKCHKKSLSNQITNVPLILKKTNTGQNQQLSNKLVQTNKLDVNFYQWPIQVKKQKSNSHQIEFNKSLNQKNDFGKSLKVVNESNEQIQKNNFMRQIIEAKKVRKGEERE